MAASKVSKELLDQLTDEEREGVEDDSQDETSSRITDEAEDDAAGGGADEKTKTDAAAKAKADAAAGDDKGADKDDADAAAMAEAEKRQNEEKAKKAADDKNPDKKAGEEAKKGEEEAEAVDAEDEEGDDEPPIPNWQPPADLKPKYDDVAKRKTDLALKFDEGDIGAKDYQAALDKLNGEEKALDREVIKAETKAEMGRDMRIANWTEVTVPDFIADHPEYEDPDLNAMLDAKVRQLQTAEDSPYLKTPLSPRILEAAHKALSSAAAKLTGGKVAGGDEAEPKKGVKDKLEVKKPAERKLAPNLGGLPASDINDTGEGRFAQLDKLKGIEYENALAKLSEADQEAYMAQ